MKEVKNILLVGVGGQGTILASKVLSTGLLDAGYDVKMSEVHGMAQRGGSVTTQIRYGEKVYSPIIGIGEADIVVAFEKMESLRFLEYLKKGGKMVVNNYEIPSATILSGSEVYPPKIIEELKAKSNLVLIDAMEAATKIGNIKTMNIILLGALVEGLGLTHIDWEVAIKKNVKPGFETINIEAFELGRKAL